MRTLGIGTVAILLLLGLATEIGALGVKRMPPRRPMPYSVRAAGGLGPTRVYSATTGPYATIGRYRFARSGLRGYDYRPYGYPRVYRPYGYRRVAYRPIARPNVYRRVRPATFAYRMPPRRARR